MSYIENVAGFIFTVNIKLYLTDSLDTFTPSVSEENHPAVPRINGPKRLSGTHASLVASAPDSLVGHTQTSVLLEAAQ